MPGFFKELKKIKKSIDEFRQNQSRYVDMPSSELSRLTDDELFEAAAARTANKVDRFESITDGINSLTHAERVFYAASYYEMEVNNGGLCQFFVNASRVLAPMLADCLDEISASDHKALFERFVQDNGIDVNDLSSFRIDDINDYPAQTERYPFDAFDRAFYELKPIQELLPSYVRSHISEF